MKVRIGPYRKNRAEKIEIEPFDTWSMDATLAMIIHPMLVQLKDTQHGHPDKVTEKEWDDILDEMIWAFEQKCRDDWMEDYYNYEEDASEKFGVKLVSSDPQGLKAHQERMTYGFKLFGKWYEALWD